MRQVGIVAAAGIYAIENNRASLSLDHQKAKVLAAGLSSMKSVSLDTENVETNIIVFDLKDGRLALDVLQELSLKGIKMIPFGPKTIRATTHRDVTMSDIECALDVAQTVLN